MGVKLPVVSLKITILYVITRWVIKINIIDITQCDIFLQNTLDLFWGYGSHFYTYFEQ